jgi:hypothetical protein
VLPTETVNVAPAMRGCGHFYSFIDAVSADIYGDDRALRADVDECRGSDVGDDCVHGERAEDGVDGVLGVELRRAVLARVDDDDEAPLRPVRLAP